MPSNQKLLVKGIKRLAFSLPLLFLGPTVIYNAFMNKHTTWHCVVLGFGISICILAVYCLFSGLKTMVQSIFNE
jgi:hypothetical protein